MNALTLVTYQANDTFAKTKSFITRHYKKVATASLAVKFISVFALLVVVPGLPKANGYDPKNTEIRFDTNSPMALVTASTHVEIASGTSNLDAQKAVKPRSQLASANYGRATSRDGSYFQPIYKAASAQFGVPWKLLQAVHYVETGCSDSGQKSSYAGAQGPMQFMSGTWRHYGVDGDGNGVADVNNVTDAIYGGANYLAANGASSGDLTGALLHYNHSMSYVYKVLDVYNSIQG